MILESERGIYENIVPLSPLVHLVRMSQISGRDLALCFYRNYRVITKCRFRLASSTRRTSLFSEVNLQCPYVLPMVLERNRDREIYKNIVPLSPSRTPGSNVADIGARSGLGAIRGLRIASYDASESSVEPLQTSHARARVCACVRASAFPPPAPWPRFTPSPTVRFPSPRFTPSPMVRFPSPRSTPSPRFTPSPWCGSPRPASPPRPWCGSPRPASPPRPALVQNRPIIPTLFPSRARLRRTRVRQKWWG